MFYSIFPLADNILESVPGNLNYDTFVTLFTGNNHQRVSFSKESATNPSRRHIFVSHPTQDSTITGNRPDSQHSMADLMNRPAEATKPRQLTVKEDDKQRWAANCSLVF